MKVAIGEKLKDEDFGEFDLKVSRMHEDIKRLDTIKKITNSGRSLDMMFIMDCTGSMSSWIRTCKDEIRSIIDGVVT